MPARSSGWRPYWRRTYRAPPEPGARQAGFEFLANTSRHDDHLIQDFLLVQKLGQSVAETSFKFASLSVISGGHSLPAALARAVNLVGLRIEVPNFFDQTSQLLQVGFPGNGAANRHDAVKRSFGGSQRSFSAWRLLLAYKPETIKERRCFNLRLLDPPANFDFLITREQRHFAHLFKYIWTGSSQVSNRGSASSSAPAGLLLNVREADDFNVKVVKFATQVIRVALRHIGRQNVVDVIVGNVTLFAGQLDEGFEDFSHIHHRRGWSQQCTVIFS